MSEKNIHYVATLEEGRELVKGIDHFWVGACGCRAKPVYRYLPRELY